MKAAPQRRRTPRGERSVDLVIRAAERIAGIEGFEALTIGKLAEETGLSKAGLFEHFGSREALQLATVAFAAQRFVEEVILPSMQEPEPGGRLRLLCSSWIHYNERRFDAGGCSLCAGMYEYARREGTLHEQIRAAVDHLRIMLEQAILAARDAGAIRSNIDPAQFAFELHAIVIHANALAQMHRDPKYFDRARTWCEAHLGSQAGLNPKP